MLVVLLLLSGHWMGRDGSEWSVKAMIYNFSFKSTSRSAAFLPLFPLEAEGGEGVTKEDHVNGNAIQAIFL